MGGKNHPYPFFCVCLCLSVCVCLSVSLSVCLTVCLSVCLPACLPVCLLSATVRVYSLVAPCCLPDLTSLALLGSVSGQRRLSRDPLPGYKMVSKWRLQLQDSTPPPLTFTKIWHHSSHLSIFGMLSPVYSHARLSPGTSWSSVTAVI